MQAATQSSSSSSEATKDEPERKPSEAKQVPTVKQHPLWGSTIAFQENQGQWVADHVKEYGDVFKARIVLDDWVFVNDPAMIYDITVGRWADFYKPAFAKKMWFDFIGNGLVPNDGESWKRQHKLVLPAFHRKRINKYAVDMVTYTDRMLEGWKDGERRDIRVEMNALLLAIVGKTLLNIDIGDETSHSIGKAMYDVCEATVEYVELPIRAPRWWPSARNKRKWNAIESLEKIIYDLVEDRRRTGTDEGDLLSMLVQARDEEGAMSDKQLRDEAMTLIFAGHETTAHALTWTWWLLASNPEAAQKLKEEVDAVVGPDRPITVEDVPKMPYLKGVVQESLRMLPSVWTFMRENQRDMEIGGYFFPKGTNIFISPLMLGMDERIHPEATKFKPERWTREYEKNLPRGSQVNFAAGPRVCMGKTFATIEMQMILGTLAQRVEFTVPEGFEPDRLYQLSMHPGPKGIDYDPEFREEG